MTHRAAQDAGGEAPPQAKGPDANATASAALEQRAAELRAIIEQPDEKEVARAELARIEQLLAEAREAQHRSAAEQRLLGIRRAYGSVATSIDGDEQRVREKVAELTDTIRRLNERYTQAMMLSAEAAALCDRFGLSVPALPPIVAPAQRELDCTPEVGLVRSAHLRPTMEHCEHELRERRTYDEVRGTEGYRIIAAAGRKPWPALTERQQRFVEERAREQAEGQRQFARMGQAVEAATRALDAVPGMSGVSAL